MRNLFNIKNFPLRFFLAIGIVSLVFQFFLNKPLFFESLSPQLTKTADSDLTERQDYKNIVELQKAFIRNAKRIKPTVVSINKIQERSDKSSLQSFDSTTPKPWFSSFREWLAGSMQRKRYQVESVGSGVILDANGYIVTNHHVIADIPNILVRLSNGRDYYAKLIKSDPMTDLAVLKISSIRRFPYPAFGKSDQLKVGEWVMAIGNPYGLEGTVTVGVVSGKGRTDLGITTFENFIQTDASINPGNSGGPLINLAGEVIGINTAVAEIGSGVGFAIPFETAIHVASQLIENGEVERGWLGVGIQSLTPDLASSFNLTSLKNGFLVNSVEQKTPAEDGGMQRGDIIILFDGMEVPGSKKFQKMVADTEIGKVVTIKVIRNGAEKNLKIKIGKLSF